MVSSVQLTGNDTQRSSDAVARNQLSQGQQGDEKSDLISDAIPGDYSSEDRHICLRAQELLPTKSRFARIGTKYWMHFLDTDPAGVSAKPVAILLHGNPTWCFYFRNLISVLSDTHRVLAPDHLGCGLSTNPTEDAFSADKRAEHILELLDTLGVNKASFVMHDWGGPIGTFAAVSDPSRIEQLVYLNTTLTETESLPVVIKRAAKGWLGRLITQRTNNFLSMTTRLGVQRTLSKEEREGYLLPYKTQNRRKAIWEFVQDIPFDDRHPSYKHMLSLANALPSLSAIPTKIIWGLRDICFHKGMLTRVARQFPQAQVLEIPDASHLVLEDQPQLVCEEIRSFLNREDSEKSPLPWSKLNGTRSYIASSARVNPFYQSFAKRAETVPHSEAVIAPIFFGDEIHATRYSYGELYTKVNQYRRGLKKLGLKPGDRVLMLVKPGVEFLALSYAVMGSGATACFLDPGMGREKLIECIKHLQPAAFIGSPKAHILRLLHKSLFKEMSFHVIVSNWGLPRAKNLNYLKRFAALSEPAIASSAPALIAYTSGATGTPKAVVYDAEMAESQLRILQEEFQLKSGERDVPLLPIFSLFHLALGVTSIYAPLNPSKPLEFDPQKLLTLMNSEHVTTSFGSPTLWGKLSEYALRTSQKLETVHSVFMAGAPVSPSLVKQVKRVLVQKDAEIFTPYGATEALPVTLVSGTQIIEQDAVAAKTGEIGTFVGSAVPTVSIRIVKPFSDTDPVTEEELITCADLEIGEVLVSGANVSKEYFENWQANSLTKIYAAGVLWHRIGDMGYMSAGKLFFCGRKAHSFIHKGHRLCSVPVERIFNEHEKVRRSALISLRDDGSQPALVVEPEPTFFPKTHDDEVSLEQELLKYAERDQLSSLVQRVFFHPSFPVDPRHNAKVFTDKLQAWARSRLASLHLQEKG